MKIHKKPKADKRANKKKLGYLHVYTGDGKGKTSAALGVLLRAAGQGHQVLMIQFLKGHKDSGEFLAFQKLGPQVEIVQFGREDLHSLEDLQAIDAYFAGKALDFARQAMRSNRPDVLILDELATAVDKRLVQIQDVVDFLDNRHQETEVIITGRNAHAALLNLADLVTVMTSAKDYYGYKAFEPRLGIEH